MAKKKYVVDMNMLEAPELAQHMQENEAAEYVIPDVAFVEMCKHTAFLSTMRQALRAFENDADRIRSTHSVGELLRDEMAALSLATRRNILSLERTERGRRIVRDVLSGREDAAAEIEAEFGQARENLLAADLHAGDAKARTEQGLAVLQGGLPFDLKQAVCSRHLSHERYIAFVWCAARIFTMKWLRNKGGWSAAGARRFVKKNPLVFRFQFLSVRHTLQVLRNGGDISKMKPEKELNNQLDFDYVLTASYFDGLLSKDKRVKDAHLDLMNVLGTPPEAMQATVDAWFKELEAQHRR